MSEYLKPPYKPSAMVASGMAPSFYEIGKLLMPNETLQGYVSQIAVAMSAEKLTPAFELSRKWMLDSGCGKDLISKSACEDLQHLYVSMNPITFNTANGPTSTRNTKKTEYEIICKTCLGQPSHLPLECILPILPRRCWSSLPPANMPDPCLQ